MDCGPDKKSVSLKLSEALSEIGVNDRIVKMGRKSYMVEEHMWKVKSEFENDGVTKYFFGSQIEGTTIVDLKSDVDIVLCLNEVRVIQNKQDITKYKPSVTKLLRVQDENTSPGYCFLQKLDGDEQADPDSLFHRDEKGRILLSSTGMNSYMHTEGLHQNGPAHMVPAALNQLDKDVVYAFQCEDWPTEAREWLNRECIGKWPSNEFKQLAVSKGCLIVPVSSKLNNQHEEFEWRISTSHAERLMMFDLNIIQIRCYVMMKLLNKTFLTKDGESIISSFMCKCTLFHCIENTLPDYWHDDNLFPCVMKCISELYDRVDKLNCPHYIIPANNLMAGRINHEQRKYLKNILQSLIKHNLDMFFAIEICDLGSRLNMKLNEDLNFPRDVLSHTDLENYIIKSMYINHQRFINYNFNYVLINQCFDSIHGVLALIFDGLRRLKNGSRRKDDLEVEASIQFTLIVYSIIGSLLASRSVQANNNVSQIAVWFLCGGYNSGISSCGLKLASAYYCCGDVDNAELTLRHIESLLAGVFLPCCACHRQDFIPTPWTCRNTITIAECVKFMRCESSIMPQELTQEFYRSSEEERHNRSIIDKRWMDFAVVDYVPYLYFMQYEVYKHLQRREEQAKALNNLLKTILNDKYLGHRDTALNLLGQCMEQENLPVKALMCYNISLKVRPHNNAANFLRRRITIAMVCIVYRRLFRENVKHSIAKRNK